MAKPKLAAGQVYPHMVQNPDTGEIEIVYKPYQQGEFASDEEYAAARGREQGIVAAGADPNAPGGWSPPSTKATEAIVGPVGSGTNPAGPTLEEQIATIRVKDDEARARLEAGAATAADYGQLGLAQPSAEQPASDEESELEALLKQLQINDVAKASSGQDIFTELSGQSAKFSEEIVGYSKTLEQLFSTTGVVAPKLDLAAAETNAGPMPTPESVLSELRASEKTAARYEGKAGAPSKYSEAWAYVQQEPGWAGGTTEKVRSQAFNDIYQQRLKVWNEQADIYRGQAQKDYNAQLTSMGSLASSKIATQSQLYDLQLKLLEQQIEWAWDKLKFEDAAVARAQLGQIEALKARLTKRGQDIDLGIAEMQDKLARWQTGWDAVKFFSANPSAYFVAQQLAGGMPLLTAWGAPDFRKLATKFFQDTAILSAQQLAQMSPTERQFYLAGKGMQGLSPEDLAALTERLTPKQPGAQKKITREAS